MDYKNQLQNLQSFFGGTSFDKKIGTPSSLQYLRGFDWRKNPSELVQAMQARKIDAGNLDGLPVNIVQVITGERFMITDVGSLWLIKTDNTLLKVGDIGERSGIGMVYRSDTDLLYIAGITAIHTYGLSKHLLAAGFLLETFLDQTRVLTQADHTRASGQVEL